MRLSLHKLFLILTLLLAGTAAAEQRVRSDIADLQGAMRYCDTAPLVPIEGIWCYPDDGVTVLVKRSQTVKDRFDVVALESDDTRIAPGDIIGEIVSSPDPSIFRLSLNTRSRANILTDPAECLATLSKDESAIYVKMKKRSLTLNATWILPRFWRIARIKTKDPLETLPAGMTRIYPSYDGNGSSLHEPRYL